MGLEGGKECGLCNFNEFFIARFLFTHPPFLMGVA